MPAVAQRGQHIGLYTPGDDAAAIAAAQAKAAAAAAEAPRIAERYGLAPLAELADAAVAAPDRIAAMRAWNEGHHVPLHNGFERALEAPRQVELTADLVAANPVVEQAGGLAVETGFDKLAWGATVRVTGAFRLRLHLSRVSLPPGARLWVSGAGHTVGPFGGELIGPDGGLWTPSVPGEEAALDVELPAAALTGRARFGFVVDKVLELFDLGSVDMGVAQDSLGCNLDARCYTSADFPAIESVRHAVAMIYFFDSGSSGQCTAELLNSSTPGVPFLLTANHCLSTPQGARSLEAFWDYYTATCNGPNPGLDALPKSFGARLLATGAAPAQSDFTLLQLNSVPAGRSFLGWSSDPNAAPNGTLLYRLSHPEGLAQDYVVTTADSTTPECSGVPRPTFLYSDFTTGGSFGGSSGSAALLANGEVVAQLYGSCGSDDDCSPQQTTVDGAFATSFQTLQQFLQPANVGGVCKPDAGTLCLLGKRFKVQVTWTNQFDGSSGFGSAVASTDSTGFFYFTDPSNYELIVKILNFGSVIKVFYGELTDLHFTITVTDTTNGTVKTYQNTAGDCGGIDPNAFTAAAAAVPGAKRGAGPAPGAIAKRGSCAPSSHTLCLLDRRFAVSVAWMNQFDGSSGVGSPRSLSDQSGLFTFTDPTVVELVMKMVDFGDRTAFFYGTLSNLEYDITVTDTVGGTTKTYHNAANNYCGGLDNMAFPP
ncbi:MAG: trypsin-like peptidase domain-containing protein, partial [Acidobacteria bacterium]|nr:trypsin-like peptidase domain-containing protein [Acidobacteriota bacterium]